MGEKNWPNKFFNVQENFWAKKMFKKVLGKKKWVKKIQLKKYFGKKKW